MPVVAVVVTALKAGTLGVGESKYTMSLSEIADRWVPGRAVVGGRRAAEVRSRSGFDLCRVMEATGARAGLMGVRCP